MGLITQQDPIGIAGGLNLYGYANGDPVNFSDPFGLAPCPPICTENELAWMALGSSVGFWLGGGFGGAVGAVGGPVAAGTSVAGAAMGAAAGGAVGVAVGGLIDAGIHFFASRGGRRGGSDRPLGIDQNASIESQLRGTGQLRDLRSNPNFRGVDVDDLLSRTPAELDELRRAGDITRRTYRTIMKAFEGRNLGGG